MKQFKPAGSASDKTDSESLPTPPRHGESYRDIKNRPPDVVKTWQELMDGEMVQGAKNDDDDDDEEPTPKK